MARFIRTVCTPLVSRPDLSRSISSPIRSVSRSTHRLRRACAPVFEGLEHRQLLASINVTAGVLVMDADKMTTSITVDYSTSTKEITATINTFFKVYPASMVQGIRINGSANPETIQTPCFAS